MFGLCCNCSRSYCNSNMEKYDIDMNMLITMKKEGALVLDVRSPQEYREGHIDGSIVIPDYEIRRTANNIIKDKKQVIIVYCSNGIRSKRTMQLLQKMGYVNVYNLYKGIENY